VAVYPTLGTGPISFVDGNSNQQELPLNHIFSSPTGWDATTAPLYTAANQSLIDALLQQLASQGFVAAAGKSLAEQSTPQTTVTAVQAGAPGNSITLTFTNLDASKGTFDVTATATETFPDLTPSKSATAGSTIVEKAMGNSAATATGLVFATDKSGLMPAAYSSSASYSAPVDVPDTKAGTAFTLTATNSADAANAALISIKVTPGATTFAVTISWTQSASGKKVSDLVGGTPPFSYLVQFSGPTGPLPSGTVTLAGGKNAEGTNAAVKASASIYASL